MKLISHSTPDKPVKVNVPEAQEKEKEPRKKRETKEEKEKKGRYWGIILLLLSVLGGIILRFL
jgi:hypothetical protein